MRLRSTEPLLLIAEVGVNHDGDCARAAEMVRAAAEAGFDAVKFQHWRVDELLAPSAPNAPYQGPGDQRDLLARLLLDRDALVELRGLAAGLGVGFVVTPDGEQACADVVELAPDALKIGSGDADNPWLVDAALASRLPLIISTGMMNWPEVERLAARTVAAPDVTLLHCVSAYPTPIADAALGRMVEIGRRTGRPVGFSDHTLGVAAPAAAVALGAVAIEKHVTWSTSAPGPDHAASLGLDDAARWVTELRAVRAAVDEARSNAEEAANRLVVRKALYVRRPLPAGHVLGAVDLIPLRPLDDGIPAGELDTVVGRRLRRQVKSGQVITRDDLA